jgi:predicted transcriptional regulator
MNASDVMTRDVVSVSPDTPTGEIAKVLLDKGISAVPVVDSTGAPVGMVSEGISDTSWRSLLHQAREAAEHGEQELMLLRFPSELCSDSGWHAPIPH